VRNRIQLDRMRYALVIGAPHSTYRIGTTYALGPKGLRCQILRDDFQAVWNETEVVTNDANYRSYYGKIHYVQTLQRDHALIMRPGQQYRLTISFEPDLAFAGE
jgi:hypothetical protein